MNTWTQTTVWRYTTGAPERSNFVLLSNFVSWCKHSNGCPPLRIQGPQYLVEAVMNSAYVARSQAEARCHYYIRNSVAAVQKTEACFRFKTEVLLSPPKGSLKVLQQYVGLQVPVKCQPVTHPNYALWQSPSPERRYVMKMHVDYRSSKRAYVRRRGGNIFVAILRLTRWRILT